MTSKLSALGTRLPSKRVLAVGLVAAMLLLAGCSGNGGGDNGSNGTEAAAGEETTAAMEDETTAAMEDETTAAMGNETEEGEEENVLTVTVEDSEGEPVENATVEVSDEGGILSGIFGDTEDPGAVSPEGEVSVELADGNYTVNASADGFEEGGEEVELDGADEEVTVTLEESGEATTAAMEDETTAAMGNETEMSNETEEGEEENVLTVTVEDSEGEPVENATVEVSDEGGILSGIFGDTEDPGAVSPEGEVSVELADGNYTVNASADGFEEGGEEVELDGADEEVTVTLEESGEATTDGDTAGTETDMMDNESDEMTGNMTTTEA